ncbi:MAG: hypothetical protein NZ550_03620 [Fimbriimonadales bacterium]|nr:hypothetical protein [Fimbriimonadales bacterium]MDW8051002.1 hypothetical protein [Armatimonadota bacterium]
MTDGRWDGREPIFHDVPFEQSEWAALHATLAQVNPVKAELVRVQYETVRIAYRNYREALNEERERYQKQREIDLEYNARLHGERARLLSQIEGIRHQREPELDALRRQLDEARLQAFRLAARTGVQLREDPEAGLEIVNPSQPPEASLQKEESSEPRSRNLPLVARFWRRSPQRVAPSATDVPAFADATPLAPLTPEEVAHAPQLPTNHAPAAPPWLPWGATIAVGLALGQILLAAMEHPWGAWQSPTFWIASIAGVLIGIVWYRAVWSLSRAITELYYLHDWEARKAHRAAWLGGGVLIVVLLLPMTALLMAIMRLPAAGAADSLLLAVLTTVLTVPLLALALVGGYFYGRAAVVHNIIQSKVTAALREHQHAEHAQTRAAAASESPESDDLPRGADENEKLTPQPPANHSSPTPVSESPRSSSPPAEVREAVAEVRALHKAWLRLQAVRQEELSPYERLLNEMQPRPIYDYLPPHAERRIGVLYAQWLKAYVAFLDYVGEAVRECKDGEQLQQRISAFRQAIER